MIKLYQWIIMGCAIICWPLKGQLADKSAHEATAAKFVQMFNDKKYQEIYGGLGDKFKAALIEKDFIAFLDENVYQPFGKIEKLEYLGYEQEQHAFITHFKDATLRMNLAVSAANKIDGLRLLPYQERPATRVLDYRSDNKKLTGLDSAVDAVVSRFIQEPQNCGISIGISKNGKQTFYNYGEIKRNSGVLPTPQSLYEIGSLTKTFCGLLLAQAVTEKKINLEDDIRNYLPGKYPNLVFGKRFIQVKHLANHSSGLQRVPADLLTSPGFDSLNPYKNYNRAMLLKQLTASKPLTEPGSTSEYSNFGMALLGIILENVYAKPFETLVEEKICVPNNMHSTAVKLNGEQVQNFADGYNAMGAATPHWELNAFVAAGGLRSTAEDMLKYLEYNLREKDEAATLAHMETFSGREKIALAWFIKSGGPLPAFYWHNGATYGFGSFAAFSKEKNCATVILANSPVSLDFIGIAILKQLSR